MIKNNFQTCKIITRVRSSGQPSRGPQVMVWEWAMARPRFLLLVILRGDESRRFPNLLSLIYNFGCKHQIFFLDSQNYPASLQYIPMQQEPYPYMRSDSEAPDLRHQQHRYIANRCNPLPEKNISSSKPQRVNSVFFSTAVKASPKSNVSRSRLRSSMKTVYDKEQKNSKQQIRQYQNVKHIAMINAYDPSRLKNVTIKKQGLAEFFSKHNPDTDALGQLYVTPIINHFNEWKKKISKRYQEVFLEFVRYSDMEKLESIGEELRNIEVMSFHMLDLVETVLLRYENHKIRQLAEQFKSSLLKSIQFLKALALTYEVKKRMYAMIKHLQSKKTLKKILENLETKKMQQIQTVFEHHHNKASYESEIVRKIVASINKMSGVTVHAVDKLGNIKSIINRVKKVLQNCQDDFGLQGLSKVNGVFAQVLDETRLLQKSAKQLEDNSFFGGQMREMVYKYQKEMEDSKNTVLQLIFHILWSILSTTGDRLRAYHSINEALKSGTLQFSRLQTVLKNVADSLEKQKLAEEPILRQFIQEISPLLSSLKSEYKGLSELAASITGSNKSFEELEVSKLKKLSKVAKQYKNNIASIAYKFEVTNSRLQRKEVESVKKLESRDGQVQFIERCIECLDYLKKLKLSQLSYLNPEKHYSFRNESQVKRLKTELESGKQSLVTINIEVNKIVELRAKNRIPSAIGPLNIKLPFLNNLPKILQFICTASSISKENAVKMSRSVQEKLQTIESCGPMDESTKNITLKALFVSLSRVIDTRSSIEYLKTIVKLIKQNKDYSKVSKPSAEGRRFLEETSQAYDFPQYPQIKQAADEILGVYNNIDKINELEAKDNRYYPNSRFVETLTKHLFSYLFVRGSQELDDNKKRKKQAQAKPRMLEVSIKVMEAQLNKLNQIKDSSLDYIRDRTSEIIPLLTQLKETLAQIIGQKQVQNTQLLTQQYPKFLDCAIQLLSLTTQPFFCLLTDSKEPFYLSIIQNGDFYYLLPRFLTAMGLNCSKEQLSRLKNDWKSDSYTYLYKRGSSKSKSTKGNKEESDDVIEESVGKVIQLQQDILDEVPGGSEGKMPQEGVVDQMLEQYDIGAQQIGEQMIEQVQDVQKESGGKGKDKALFSQKYHSAPKQSIQEISFNKQLLKRNRKPVFIKMKRIESINSFISSIHRTSTFMSEYKDYIQLGELTEAVNQIYIWRFVRDEPDSKIGGDLSKAKELVKSLQQSLTRGLRGNIFKDFIQGDPRVRSILSLLQEIESNLIIENMSEQRFPSISTPISNIFKQTNQRHYVLTRRANIILQSSSPDLGSKYIRQVLKQMTVQFTEQQTQAVIKECIDSEQSGSFGVKNYGILDIKANNGALKQLQDLEDEWAPQGYDSTQVETVFSELVNCYTHLTAGSVSDAKTAIRRFTETLKKMNQRQLQQLQEKVQGLIIKGSSAVDAKLKRLKQSREKGESKLEEDLSISEQSLRNLQPETINKTLDDMFDNHLFKGTQSKQLKQKIKLTVGKRIAEHQEAQRKRLEEEDRQRRLKLQEEERLRRLQEERQRQRLRRIEEQKERKRQKEEQERKKREQEEEDRLRKLRQQQEERQRKAHEAERKELAKQQRKRTALQRIQQNRSIVQSQMLDGQQLEVSLTLSEGFNLNQWQSDLLKKKSVPFASNFRIAQSNIFEPEPVGQRNH